MQPKNSASFKQQIYEACKQVIETRMRAAEQAMKAAQESANSEEKSSAGDKYETGRAMSQIDRDRSAKQLLEAKKELDQLNKIDLTLTHNEAGIGALITCNEAVYFIATAVGNIDLQGTKVTVLSPKAPLTRILMGKKVTDTVSFNGKNITIHSIS